MAETGELEDALDRHHRELTRNLRNLDIVATKAKWSRENPGRIPPSEEAVLAGMHKARILYGRMTAAEKTLSAQWLAARGYSVPPPHFGGKPWPPPPSLPPHRSQPQKGNGIKPSSSATLRSRSAR